MSDTSDDSNKSGYQDVDEYRAEKRRYYQGLINQYNDELEAYKNDYSILTESEVLLANMMVICDSTDHSLDAIKYSIQNVVDTLHSSSIQIPEMDNLVNFDEFTESGGYLAVFNAITTELKTAFANKCAQIDAGKKEAADKIQEYQNLLASAQFQYNLFK